MQPRRRPLHCHTRTAARWYGCQISWQARRNRFSRHAFAIASDNGCVRRLNTKIASVPGNIVARRFGFELAAYYEVEHAADRTRPEVSFLKNLMTIAHRRRD